MQAVAGFVDRLYEHSGFSTWTSFAKAAEVNWQSLSDWHTGKKEISGWGMLQLMGAVKPAAVLAALGATADARAQAAQSVRPATLEGSVAALLAWQPTVGADLDEIRSRLEKLETPAVVPRGKDGRAGTG